MANATARTLSRAQIERYCLENVAHLIRTDQLMREKYDRPQILYFETDSVDVPFKYINRIDGSKVKASDTTVLKALKFLEENNKANTDRVIGVCVDPNNEITRNKFVFFDLEKFLPEIFARVVLVQSSDESIYHGDPLDLVLSQLTPIDQTFRWGTSGTSMTDNFYGILQKCVVLDIIGGSYQDLKTRNDVVDVCTASNFYVDQIRGMLASEEVTGIIFRSEDDSAIVAFMLFNVTSHMPVNNQKACTLHIHYALVRSDQRRNNHGTSLLNLAIDEATTKFPGCTVLAEVESKPSEAAVQFWFGKQNFQLDAQPRNGHDAPMPGMKTIQPSHLWSELGKIYKQDNDPEQFSAVMSLLFGDIDEDA